MSLPIVRGVGAFGSGTTSFTAAVPTGGSAPQAGDAMYIVMESSDSTTAAGTPATPNGWSLLYEQTVGAGATGVTTLTVFGKIAGAGEANVTVSGVGDHCAGAMVVIGDHGLTAITDTVVGAQSNHGTTQNGCSTSGITVHAASMIILAIGFTDDANDTTNGSSYANANLASITERIDQTVSTGAGGGVGIVTATCAGTTTGATTWNHDTAANSQSVHLGIAPVVITGTGALVAQAADVTGSGVSLSTGSGAANAQAADVTGTGVSLSTGIGALLAQAAAVDGEGTVETGAITGAGALSAQAAGVTGEGVTLSTGAGALAAQAGGVAGAGASLSIGTGTLTVSPAAVSGAGVSLSTGSGELAAQPAELDGEGAVEETVAPQAQGWLLPNWSWIFAAMMSTPPPPPPKKKKRKRKKREEEEATAEGAAAFDLLEEVELLQRAHWASEAARAQAANEARAAVRRRRNAAAMFLCS